MNTTITCEKAKFTIPGKSGEDFAYLPVIEKDEGTYYLSVYFKRDDSSDYFLNCSNENNKLMTGELFEIKDNT